MVEIDGRVCTVNLAENVKRLLPSIISCLTKGGVMQVTQLTEDFRIESITDQDVDPT